MLLETRSVRMDGQVGQEPQVLQPLSKGGCQKRPRGAPHSPVPAFLLHFSCSNTSSSSREGRELVAARRKEQLLGETSPPFLPLMLLCLPYCLCTVTALASYIAPGNNSK